MKTKKKNMACERITVAGVQISQGTGSLEASISPATKAITAARGRGIYVLPELSGSGYGVDVL